MKYEWDPVQTNSQNILKGIVKPILAVSNSNSDYSFRVCVIYVYEDHFITLVSAIAVYAL